MVQLDHCVIQSTDWERSNAFYKDVLGAEVVEGPDGFAYRFGQQQLNVHGPGHTLQPSAQGGPSPYAFPCFVWKGPIQDAMEHVAEKGVTVVEGPVPRFGAAGHGTSIYFNDPDGTLLELISYA